VVKEFLNERGVEYALRDVVSDPEAQSEFQALGHSLPPVVVLGGRSVAGYDPDALEELLAERTESDK
jgi:glutaredoxin 3